MKRPLALVAIACLTMGSLSACGSKDEHAANQKVCEAFASFSKEISTDDAALGRAYALMKAGDVRAADTDEVSEEIRTAIDKVLKPIESMSAKDADGVSEKKFEDALSNVDGVFKACQDKDVSVEKP